jgi:hypothetical protein
MVWEVLEKLKFASDSLSKIVVCEYTAMYCNINKVNILFQVF